MAPLGADYVAVVNKALLKSLDYEAAKPGIDALLKDKNLLTPITKIVERELSLTRDGLAALLDLIGQGFDGGTDLQSPIERAIGARQRCELDRRLHDRHAGRIPDVRRAHGAADAAHRWVVAGVAAGERRGAASRRHHERASGAACARRLAQCECGVQQRAVVPHRAGIVAALAWQRRWSAVGWFVAGCLPDGNVLIVARDISERRRMERELTILLERERSARGEADQGEERVEVQVARLQPAHDARRALRLFPAYYLVLTLATVAGIVLLFILLITKFVKGFFANIAVLLGLVLGMVIAIALGKVSFSGLAESGWFAVVRNDSLAIGTVVLAAALVLEPSPSRLRTETPPPCASTMRLTM